MDPSAFITHIRSFAQTERRDLEWRRDITPYKVLISEMMLQQTQVSRVSVKFPLFIEQFPTIHALHEAAVADVLAAWQGMGYNRRALFLKRTASIIVNDHGGILPSDPPTLQSFPGIGYATARSIAAFAFNKPTVFIETNIRRVFIHFFFEDHTEVHDSEILPLVELTLDTENPREWYYALMDYGSRLVKITQNPNRRSKHYTKQSPFEGSERKVRGQIIRALLRHGPLEKHALERLIEDQRLEKIVAAMIAEGFIKYDGSTYSFV